ncbi:MAG TPA: aldehyde dehydrogenase family protein [Propionibacteriaceae bacterium]|nr:aldehyde dehydrogenase family protein [Propionibacteriaceae bacterium]
MREAGQVAGARRPTDAAAGAASKRYEARCVCLIFGPWNLPFHLFFEPTVAALAAGNTAIVKPNSLTPGTARVIREIVQAVFEERLVRLRG